MKKYKIIYADPAWSYNDKMGNDSAFMSATSAYPTMALEDIKALKVNEIADKDCVLFLWCVSPLLPEALEVIKAWGFKYGALDYGKCGTLFARQKRKSATNSKKCKTTNRRFTSRT